MALKFACVHSWAKPIASSASCAGLVLAASVALAPPVTASSSWSFTGQITMPDRYGGKATIAGDITIPDGVTCSGTQGDGYVYGASCAVFLVPQGVDGRIPDFIPGVNDWSSDLPRYHIMPLATVPRGVSGPTTVYVSGETYTEIPAGKTWRWVIGGYQFRSGCAAPGCIWGTYISSSLGNFSSPIVMPTRMSDRFVITSSASSVIAGESVTLSMTR